MKTFTHPGFIIRLGIILAILTCIQPSCKTYHLRNNYQNANELLHGTENMDPKPYLKAHLKNGDIFILKDAWQIDTIKNTVEGEGIHYNFLREEVYSGEVSIPIDSVAIFETNTPLLNPEEGRIAALTILTVSNIALSLYCLLKPKACFGSCPTFYIHDSGNLHYADAEGFSNAITPSLEYGDIDALAHKTSGKDTFSITMKNEALETHCIKSVKLFAFPTEGNEEIYHAPDDKFFACTNTLQPTYARAEEGDITELINQADWQERFSLADENNLCSKEEIFLQFKNPPDLKDAGLLISFRQTLMSTYLFYNGLAYMGDQISDIFAKFETDTKTREKLQNGFKEALGGIDIYQWNEQNESWIFRGSMNETGPIASNLQIIPLAGTAEKSDIKLKIVLNKGLWRIDYLGLTKIEKEVFPIEIPPCEIRTNGSSNPTALQKINATDEHLISMPGDNYKLNFCLPVSDQNYQLFLYSQGYYLEWIRREWLQEKDLPKLKEMMERPKAFLKTEAKEYKKYEEEMEEIFWNSRINAETFSNYEN